MRHNRHLKVLKISRLKTEEVGRKGWKGNSLKVNKAKQMFSSSGKKNLFKILLVSPGTKAYNDMFY